MNIFSPIMEMLIIFQLNKRKLLKKLLDKEVRLERDPDRSRKALFYLLSLIFLI